MVKSKRFLWLFRRKNWEPSYFPAFFMAPTNTYVVSYLIGRRALRRLMLKFHHYENQSQSYGRDGVRQGDLFHMKDYIA